MTLSLPGGGEPVFRGLSFELGECETALVTGRSGSGKTMLGVSLCGFLPLWVGSWELRGEVRMFGEEVVQGNPRRDVGILLDDPYTQLSGMKRTVRHELAFPLECLGVERMEMSSRIERYARAFGVEHLLDRSCKSLSGGELQRVLVAAVLLSGPRFLFLDRPLTEIDEDFRPALMEIVGNHLREVNGAALVAEDPWLIPEMEFDLNLSLGGDGEEECRERGKMTGNARIRSERGGNLLTVDSVSFGYDARRPLFRDLSFTLDRGEVAFLTGPNGAGKTTLGRLISGLLEPDSGTITIEGRPVNGMEERERFSLVGFAFQNPGYYLCRRTVRDELETAEDWGNPPGELVETLGLGPLLDRHPLELTQAEKKRLGLALACGGRRKVFILDEPSQYQDREGFELVVETIDQIAGRGGGVLIITHDPRFFEVCPDARILELRDTERSVSALIPPSREGSV